jgi:hypothetical protein
MRNAPERYLAAVSLYHKKRSEVTRLAPLRTIPDNEFSIAEPDEEENTYGTRNPHTDACITDR